MKINGRKIEGPCVEIVAFPRDGGDIVFKAQAVLDYSVFESLCPRPAPPKMRKRGSRTEVPDLEDKSFLTALEEWGRRRIDWMVLESLRATEGLEWETVDYNKPDTWKNYEEELKKSGFSPAEINILNNAALTANSLNETKLNEARDRFLRQQEEAPSNGLSQKDEHKIMPSGEPVNVSK